MRVGIIDYGVGNLGSVVQALDVLRVHPVLVERAIDLHRVDCLILPGVGNFSDCKDLLDKGDWTAALKQEVLGSERPLLGICLGMQLLADSSSEGGGEDENTIGLSFIPGHVKHLRNLGCTLRIPHVGWNGIQSTKNDNHIFNKIPNGTDFYFVHSYGFIPADQSHVIATVDYGIPVTAAVRNGHIWGVQFHPEKSSRAGLQLLKNFIENSKC